MFLAKNINLLYPPKQPGLLRWAFKYKDVSFLLVKIGGDVIPFLRICEELLARDNKI